MESTPAATRNASAAAAAADGAVEIEKHELEAEVEADRHASLAPAEPPAADIISPLELEHEHEQEQPVVMSPQNAEEKSDLEQSEKGASRSLSGKSSVASTPGRSSPARTIAIPIPKIGTHSSVFKEVPRHKDANATKGTATSALPVAPANDKETPATATGQRNEAHTIPVKIISAIGDAVWASAEQPRTSGAAPAGEPPKLPEFVDWSARTTSALYRKLEEEVARLRCEKQQAEERLDRSLQQTEIDREVIKGLQQDLRQQRDKVFECERQIRASKIGANRHDEEETLRKVNSAAGNTPRYAGSASDTLMKQREQKLLQIQIENDVLKRKIDELDDVIRRNDRLMRNVQEENQNLRSRLDTDATRFAKFEERIKQLEDALTRANQDNLHLIDQMRSQLLQEQARRTQLEQLSSLSGAVRAPPTRKTLAESATSRTSTSATVQLTKLSDSARGTVTATSFLSSPSGKESSSMPPTSFQYGPRAPEKEHQDMIGNTSCSAVPAMSTIASLSMTTGNAPTMATDGSSVAMPQSSQMTTLSSVSSSSLRRYLSLPPGARRQLTNRFISRFNEAPNAATENAYVDAANATATATASQAAAVAASISYAALPKPGASPYDSAARGAASRPTTLHTAASSGHLNLQPITTVALSSKRLPAVPAVVDQTAVQQANRLNLQEYREFLKERRRKLFERETLPTQFVAPELPAEAV